MNQFASLLGSLAGSSASLTGNSLSMALSGLQIVNKLSSVANVAEPMTSPEGVRKRLTIIGEGLTESAKLTGTTTDDKVVALLNRVTQADEVVNFLAWVVANGPALAIEVAALGNPAPAAP